MKTSTAESEPGTVTHFRVTAREMLFDQPECCPIYGGLSFDGLAIDENDGVHLIVRTTSARAYLGHELPVVARRAHILAVALVDSGVVDTDRAGGVITWLGECWTAATSEIARAAGLTAGPFLPAPVCPPSGTGSAETLDHCVDGSVAIATRMSTLPDIVDFERSEPSLRSER